MKYARLVRTNLFRNKRRTVLTILSVAVALFLFATLRSVLTTLDDAARVGSESRLITRSAISIVFDLPRAYLPRIQAVPGVKSVSWAAWFGGIYIDERNFFAQFAIDDESYLPMYPEIQIPPDQLRDYMGERTAAIVGRRLMEKFGWTLGQTITLRGTIYQGDWPFTIRAVYTPTNPSIGEETMLFHYEYLYERSNRRASPGWYVLQLDDPGRAAAVAEAVDAMFRNSNAATKTETERAFQASFLTLYGNISFLLGAIGTAVFFAILLVAANSMLMSARERTGEVAVLKTLGFDDALVFRLVLTEASVIALGGGLLGVLGAKLLFDATGFTGAGFLPGFTVRWTTVALGAGIAALLGLVSGVIPAWQAARLSVVQALRRVA